MLAVIGLLAGLAALFFGGEWLVRGASRLARSFGVSPLMVGLTVVSIGTSAPELLVSLDAALGGAGDISLGNVIGSNIANIGLILGLSGLIYPVAVHVGLLKREIPILMGLSFAVYLLMLDGTLGRLDGAMLLLALVAFLFFLVRASRTETESEDKAESPAPAINRQRELVFLAIGVLGLLVGANLTVSNAVLLARGAGVSELVIGVTLVAFGTSLPELVTSVMAAVRKESDLAIGNVIGSNIFNLAMILGATALIQPIPVASSVVQFDVLVMLLFTAMVVPFALNSRLERWESAGFLIAYLAFVVYSVVG